MTVNEPSIAERALALAEESFIAASGPGGQNVNKVATAVQLRLNIYRAAAAAAGLPPAEGRLPAAG